MLKVILVFIKGWVMNVWLLYIALFVSMVASLSVHYGYGYTPGVDHFSLKDAQKYARKGAPRIGLIMNQTSLNSVGKRTVDLLLERTMNIVALFAPEHGLDGKVKAGIGVNNGVDSKTKIPLYSLYTVGRDQNALAVFKQLDLLVFDIQDAGMRHYTYSATLMQMLKRASEYRIPFVVLDRPNSLGALMEGPVAHISNSFLASVPVPLRHGMTMGELARYYNHAVLKGAVNLHVVQLKNYRRDDQVAPFKAPLSPNIRTRDACYGYSFLGLLGEVRPFDTGVGTSKAFLRFGLPVNKISYALWKPIQRRGEDLGIGMKLHRYKHPLKKIDYVGCDITFTQMPTFSSLQFFIFIVDYIKAHNMHLDFSKEFNVSVGSSVLKDYFDGSISWHHCANKINEQLDHFYQAARPFFLYQPEPKIVYLPTDYEDLFLK